MSRTTFTWGSTAGSANAAIRPSPSRARACSSDHAPPTQLQRIAALGACSGASVRAPRPGFAAADAGHVRSSHDRFRAARPTPRPALRDVPCERGFQRHTARCGACHGVGTAVRATAKTANHILSTDRCDSCHTPVAWNPAVISITPRREVAAPPVTTASRRRAKRPRTSRPTWNAMRATRRSVGRAPSFNHEGIIGNCATCHNGVQATGMPATHIPIDTAACESCHSPSEFHDLRRRHHESRRGGWHCVRQLSRGWQDILRCDHRDSAPGATSDRRRLRPMPRINDFLHDRLVPKTGQPYSDHRALCRSAIPRRQQLCTSIP